MFSETVEKKVEAQTIINSLKKRVKNGSLKYDKISTEEFNAVIILLGENYPIFSLDFSYGMEYDYSYRPGYGYPRDYGRSDNYGVPKKIVPALNYNELTTLINILSKNNTVTHLSLFAFADKSQNIGSLIANLISTNHTLTDLKLSISLLNQTDIEAISNALSVNQSLIKLDLNDCHYIDSSNYKINEIRELIKSRLEQNKVLSKESSQLLQHSSPPLTFSTNASNIGSTTTINHSNNPHVSLQTSEEKAKKDLIQWEQWKKKYNEEYPNTEKNGYGPGAMVVYRNK